MRAFLHVVSLELKSLVRSKALPILAVAVAALALAMPRLITGDGTADGAHQLYVRYALGSAFALAVVSLGSAAAGTLSGDRAAKRLQLTLVRPVRHFAVALGRMAALTVAGAVALAVAMAAVVLAVDGSRRCWHVVRPAMESPREEAERAYAAYMADPNSPDIVRKSPKEEVVRILEQRALDRYDTVPPGATAEWKFPALPERGADFAAVRLRFTNANEMRDDVVGEFALGEAKVATSNKTQSVMFAPLPAGARPADGALRFSNLGRSSLMLRPRKDLCLVYGSSSDTFAANALTAYFEMVCMLAAVVAFGVFLGAGLGRSVAVFVLCAALLLSVVSPSAAESYHDELGKEGSGRFGYAVARLAAAATSPLESFSPMTALSDDERVEWGEVARAAALDLALLPLLLALASALVLPRKTQ